MPAATASAAPSIAISPAIWRDFQPIRLLAEAPNVLQGLVSGQPPVMFVNLPPAMANDCGMRLAGAQRFAGLAGFAPVIAAGAHDALMPDLPGPGAALAGRMAAERPWMPTSCPWLDPRLG